MELETHYSIEKIPSGYLGQCIEFPHIVTEAKSIDALNDEMNIVMDGYFEVDPKAIDTLKNHVGTGTYKIKKN